MPVNGRAKGAAGEREFISLMRDWCGDVIDENVKRNLEQVRNGGHDIVGLNNWAVEVKRYKTAGDADIKEWWSQAQSQAAAVGKIPALAYRLDRREWRVRVPLYHLYPGILCSDVAWTVELSLEAFAFLYRESLDV